MKTYPGKIYVLADLPRAGLGNRLLVWARAYAFAKKYKLPLITRGWSKLLIGPWLRREKIKRLYGGYFINREPFLYRFLEKFISGKDILNDPSFDIDTDEVRKHRLIRFSAIPHWSDYFKDIKDYRVEIRQKLLSILRPEIVAILNSLSSPVIGVHIRMGDFRPLNINEDFSKVGAVRTPLDYFKDCIFQIRSLYGSDLPVTIFSDGRKEELRSLLELPAVSMAGTNPDIVDLLLLSRSHMIVASAGSTFSYWAGFLSEAPLIVHPDHIPGLIRLPEKDRLLYEGPVSGLSKDHIIFNWNQ